MISYTLKVIEIRIETLDTLTLCFKQPGLKKIKYLAGQYLTLIFRINGRRYVRPYSFSSTPDVDETLQVTVKRVLNGVVSNHIHDTVKVGDAIEVMSPMGDFVYYSGDSRYNHIYLWGIGSGITPLISLAKQILFHSDSQKVSLVYGNRNHEQMIFSNLILKLQQQFPERLKVWHFHTQISVTEDPPYLVKGRITEDWVKNHLNGQDIGNSLHYICGPLGLKESVNAGLSKLNIKVEQILTEDFELVKNPADFEDIFTQVVHMDFGGNGYNIEVPKGKSILESALDAGLELPYSCQTGSCNTCLGKLKSGSLRMIGLNVSRGDLLIDEYLLCCSHPITSDVSILV